MHFEVIIINSYLTHSSGNLVPYHANIPCTATRVDNIEK